MGDCRDWESGSGHKVTLLYEAFVINCSIIIPKHGLANLLHNPKLEPKNVPVVLCLYFGIHLIICSIRLLSTMHEIR